MHLVVHPYPPIPDVDVEGRHVVLHRRNHVRSHSWQVVVVESCAEVGVGNRDVIVVDEFVVDGVVVDALGRERVDRLDQVVEQYEDNVEDEHRRGHSRGTRGQGVVMVMDDVGTEQQNGLAETLAEQLVVAAAVVGPVAVAVVLALEPVEPLPNAVVEPFEAAVVDLPFESLAETTWPLRLDLHVEVDLGVVVVVDVDHPGWRCMDVGSSEPFVH